MSSIDNGGPAFPGAPSEWIDHPVHGRINRADIGESPEPGMTLRDWFAGQVLSGFVQRPSYTHADADTAAKFSYLYADAMLRARKNT